MLKKNFKKILTIIGIMFLMTMCLGIGAYCAYTLNATQVKYVQADGNIIDVKSALDELYTSITPKPATLSGQELVVSERSSSSKTYTVTAADAEKYGSLVGFVLVGNSGSSYYDTSITRYWRYNIIS